MRHILINLATETGDVYISKKDLADRIGVSVATLWNWQQTSDFKRYKQYVIVFNAPSHKAISKQRSNSFQ